MGSIGLSWAMARVGFCREVPAVNREAGQACNGTGCWMDEGAGKAFRDVRSTRQHYPQKMSSVMPASLSRVRGQRAVSQHMHNSEGAVCLRTEVTESNYQLHPLLSQTPSPKPVSYPSTSAPPQVPYQLHPPSPSPHDSQPHKPQPPTLYKPPSTRPRCHQPQSKSS